MIKKAPKYGMMIIAAVLVIAMAFAGAASAAPASVPPSGTGAIDNPYLINIPGHLTWMADNAGSSSVNYYKFDCSTGIIDCGGETLKMIGNSSNKFSGIIEGNYNVLTNFSITGSSNVGLFGYYNGTRIANITLSDFSVSGNTYVGGLVGYADSENNGTFENVRVKFGNVTADAVYVGGLVGAAYSKTKNYVNCTVENCMIAATGGGCVGGMVSYAITESFFDRCAVKNCSVSGFTIVGGMVGYADSASSPAFMCACTVSNCIVSAKNGDVGGIVGAASSATSEGFSWCMVENCTIVSADGYNVGGLVGCAYSASKFNVGNALKMSAVRGNGAAVAKISGNEEMDTNDNVSQTGSIWLNKNNNANDPKIYIAKVSDKEGPEEQSFFNSEGYVCATTPAGALPVTNLTGYGKGGAYAALTYVFAPFTVTVDTVAHGLVDAYPLSGYVGTSITVTAKPSSGYHMNWTCYYYPASPSEKTEILGGTFNLPAHDVNVSGDFKPNLTTVEYYNETGVLVNTSVYAFDGLFVAPTGIPVNASIAVNGWNISSASGFYFANATFAELNTTYVDSTLWNYSNATGGVLKIHMNWTPTYPITNVTVNGTVTANQTTSVSGKVIHVDATADIGYHFVSWNVTKTSGDSVAVDGSDNFIMPAEAVNAGAKFTANVTTLYFYGDTGFLESKVNTYGQATNFTAVPSKSGFSGYWKVSESSKRLTDSTYVDGTTWKYTGGTGATLHVYVNWTQSPTPVPTQSSGGGSYSNEHTIILPGPVDSTVEPKTNPTVQPTIVPGTIPTAQPTQKSPAPFVGIIAGLGAAAVLLRLRK